jgi:TolB-like protein
MVVRPQIVYLDRTTLDKALKEPGVTPSSLTDVSTVSALGTKYKAKAIVTGEIISYGSWIRVTAKLIDAENAKLIKEAVVDVKDKAGLKSAVKSLAEKLAGK